MKIIDGSNDCALLCKNQKREKLTPKTLLNLKPAEDIFTKSPANISFRAKPKNIIDIIFRNSPELAEFTRMAANGHKDAVDLFNQALKIAFDDGKLTKPEFHSVKSNLLIEISKNLLKNPSCELAANFIEAGGNPAEYVNMLASSIEAHTQDLKRSKIFSFSKNKHRKLADTCEIILFCFGRINKPQFKEQAAKGIKNGLDEALNNPNYSAITLSRLAALYTELDIIRQPQDLEGIKRFCLVNHRPSDVLEIQKHLLKDEIPFAVIKMYSDHTEDHSEEKQKELLLEGLRILLHLRVNYKSSPEVQQAATDGMNTILWNQSIPIHIREPLAGAVEILTAKRNLSQLN